MFAENCCRKAARFACGTLYLRPGRFRPLQNKLIYFLRKTITAALSALFPGKYRRYSLTRQQTSEFPGKPDSDLRSTLEKSKLSHGFDHRK
jgi:hypothetical protein